MNVTQSGSAVSPDPSGGSNGWPRRKVLTTGIGVASIAGLAAVGFPEAAQARGTEPTSRVDAGRLIEPLNGTWDFLPATGTPAYPPPDSGWATIPVPAEWNMTSGVFATAWDTYDVFGEPSTWDSVNTAWYRRTVVVPTSRRGDRIILRFEAVNGITNADLNWPAGGQALATYTVSGDDGTSAIDTLAVNWAALGQCAEQNKYTAALESTLDFTPGSVLWQAKYGKGSIVIDEINWQTSALLPTQVGLAASIAAGLGVGFTRQFRLRRAVHRGMVRDHQPIAENPAAAYDRNPSTRWSSDQVQVPGMFYQLDLGAVHTVTKVIWDTSQSAGDYPRGVQVQTSLDGQNFTTVLTIANTASLANGGLLTLTLGSVSTQYVKIIDTGSAPGNYLSLHEIYVYAD